MRTTPASIQSGAARQGEGEAVEQFVIWPHRSLSRHGAMLLVGCTAVVFLAVAARAVMMGAWPQALYVLLAVGGLALAISTNSRSARFTQVIELAPDKIRVRQMGPSAKRRTVAEFDPAWVRVVEAPGPWDETRLLMRQSGRSIAIGEFLTCEERADLAAELRRRIASRYAAGTA